MHSYKHLIALRHQIFNYWRGRFVISENLMSKTWQVAVTCIAREKQVINNNQLVCIYTVEINPRR